MALLPPWLARKPDASRFGGGWSWSALRTLQPQAPQADIIASTHDDP